MVYVLIADGFEEIEAIGTIDILRRAEIQTMTVSIDDCYIVKSARDVKVVVDITLNELSHGEIDDGDALVLPGGGGGVKHLSKSKQVKALISAFAANNRLIAAICAAPTLLGTMGLLDGRKATCYPDLQNELFCGEYSEDAVVVDGNIVTSRGAGTTHLFAAKIVEIMADKMLADEILKKMVY